MPQGTKLGPRLFLLMINDLKVDALAWRYVDDTTVAQILPRGSMGSVQNAVSAVEAWSQQNGMQLNADKCKEMIIDLKKNFYNFSLVVAAGKEPPVSSCVKILGVLYKLEMERA